ncbi:MAG: hypothetical protein AB1393_06395 [Candidatus Edwardsbacteria bacterium]
MTVSTLLKEQVKPVLGCTEPSAVGLASAYAFKTLSEKKGIKPPQIDRIILTVDRNVYKNSFAVGLPRTGSKIGIDIAATLGIFCNPQSGLNLFSTISKNDFKKAERYRLYYSHSGSRQEK